MFHRKKKHSNKTDPPSSGKKNGAKMKDAKAALARAEGDLAWTRLVDDLSTTNIEKLKKANKENHFSEWAMNAFKGKHP